MSVPRILALAGSARRDSLNKKLARAAAEEARAAGGEVLFVDLDEFPMPLYHSDLEDAEGLPENNQSLSALLKNTIDWLSRDIGDGKGNNSGFAPYRGKVAGLMGASPGAFGAVGAMPHLRQVLSGLGVAVLPTQVPVPRADKVFDATGRITDERVARAVKGLAAALVEAARKL